MSKLPALQFYPGDWKKDPGVQALSFHDRAIWFEMLLLMHESEQRGKLLLNGKPIPHEALARLIGLPTEGLTQVLTTLLEFGVASRCEETGAIISRRMVRDEESRKKAKENGKKGGNPALSSEVDKAGVNPPDNGKDKQKQTPSSSVSISTSSSDKERNGDSVPVNYILQQCSFVLGTTYNVTDDRAKRIRARWRNKFWRENWLEALERIPDSPFLQGNNDSGWRADIDFFLKPDSVTKILEGKYDGQPKRKQTAAEAREALNASGFDWIRQAAADAAAATSSSEGGGNLTGLGTTLFE